ncbi:MAG: tRNA-dihydrouridine synthase family protein [Elusimicrobiota bacterium]|jgi:tRNA-dihydrouridine synthase
MQKPLVLRGASFDPPRFCAPMAAITHCAFRRLLGDLGGCGALFTEMLSARMILREDLERSPALKRRPGEGKVIYQLMVTETARLDEIIARLAALKPDGLDLNAACSAPAVLAQGGGADLFDTPARLRDILAVMRRCFAGPLSVKIRLGREKAGWREELMERLRMFAGEGVDAVSIHPRFQEEKFKRRARHELYAELAGATRLPIIASGDITGPESARELAAQLAPVSGIMIGRMAAAQPWVFAKWRDPGFKADPAAVWTRLCEYIAEDFGPHQAVIRVKVLAPYFARNFLFGHSFFKAMNSAPDLAAVRARSEQFFATAPALSQSISVSGI